MKEGFYFTEGEKKRIKTALSSGGFTFSPTLGMATDGYAVSIFKEKERIVRADLGTIGNNLPFIERYINDNLVFFNHRKVYVGGWWEYGDGVYGPDEYSLYLDLVVLAHNEHAARWLGRKYHQIAFYDLKHREEFKIHVVDEELLKRLEEVPRPERIHAYHLSQERPGEPGCTLGILRGSERGRSGHEESNRSGVPGVYFYEDGVEPERMIKNRAWRCEVEGLFAVADAQDPVVLRKLLGELGKGETNLRGRAETLLQEMGYDGYRWDGKLFLFGDIKVKNVRRNS